MKRVTIDAFVEDSEAKRLKESPGLIEFNEQSVRIQRYIRLPGDFCAPQGYEQKYQGKHPDLVVADSRLSLSLGVINAAKVSGLKVENNEQGFIGKLTFDQTEQLYDKLQKITGLFFISPRHANGFLSYLHEGMQKEREVKYENGESVSIEELTRIYNDWTEQRNPWRATWLNARFGGTIDNLTITHPVVQPDGKIKRVTESLDKNTLMKDRIPGIDLKDWLKNQTDQGLVTSTNKQGNVNYWYPRPNTVALFNANSGWVYFNCSGDSGGSGSALGSWPARVFSTGNEGSK